MKITKKYNRWYDENNNSWSTKELAENYSPTLENCTNCTDCYYCTHCTNCTACTDRHKNGRATENIKDEKQNAENIDSIIAALKDAMKTKGYTNIKVVITAELSKEIELIY